MTTSGQKGPERDGVLRTWTEDYLVVGEGWGGGDKGREWVWVMKGWMRGRGGGAFEKDR